jgi:NAD(P)-dependent dehydrogenase (short-subunit alcohol dehydrogenase family)
LVYNRCSTGFGREFARQALAHGFRVAATARDPKIGSDLIEAHQDNAIAFASDVTDASQLSPALLARPRAGRSNSHKYLARQKRAAAPSVRFALLVGAG